MTTTLSSREFNQDTSGAKKAANEGPVFITDRGRPAHVLLSPGYKWCVAVQAASPAYRTCHTRSAGQPAAKPAPAPETMA